MIDAAAKQRHVAKVRLLLQKNKPKSRYSLGFLVNLMNPSERSVRRWSYALNYISHNIQTIYLFGLNVDGRSSAGDEVRSTEL